MTYAERTKAMESCRPGHCAPATDRRPRSRSRDPSPSHSQSSGPLLDLDNAASPVPSTIWCQLLHAEFFCCHSTVPSRHRSFFTPTSGPSRPHANVLCFAAMRWYGKVWMGCDGMGWYGGSPVNCCPLPLADEDRHPAGHMCQAFAAPYRRRLKRH